jgi:putative ABC transport system permease protein
MNKFKQYLFVLRMAVKNIRFTKLRSFILYFSFTIITIVILLFFSLKPFVYEYFYHNTEKKYGDIDFYLTYDENSNARYFSIRELENKLDQKDLQFMAPFFEVKTLLEKEDEHFYINLHASHLETIKTVSKIPDSLTSLKANEMIVSKTLSEAHQIKVNDWINLQLGDEFIPFKVIEIVEENGLLQQNTIFIDKDANLHYLLESMGLDINPSYTKKIYNTVYFSLQDGINSNELKYEINSISDYQNLVIKDTYNLDRIKDITQRVVSVMALTFTFILLAILFVLQSTLQGLFQERRTQFGVIHSLGGSEQFSFSVILTEILLYLVSSFLTAVLLTHLIVSKGLDVVGSSLIYHIKTEAIISCAVVILITLFLFTLYNYFKVKDYSAVRLSRSDSVYKVKSAKPITILFILFILYFGVKYLRGLPIEYQALLRFSLLMGLLFTFTRVLIYVVAYSLDLTKPNLFKQIFMKQLRDEPTCASIQNVFIIAFCIIVLLVSTKSYITRHTEEIYSNIKVDYGLVNVVHNYDVTKAELNDHDQIENVDEAHLLSDIKVKEIDTVFQYLISTDVDALQYYVDFHLEDSMLTRLSDNTPYVILPNKFQYLYDLKIDDEVSVYLSPTYSNEIFKIAGFVEIDVQDVLITNLHSLNEYEDLPPNAFLINASGDQEVLKQELIKAYSKDLYYVLDFEALMDETVSQINEVTQYLSYLIQIVILCFLFTIYNNMVFVYQKMRSLYSKIIVLGCSKGRLIYNYILQHVILIGIVGGTVLSVFDALTRQIPYLLLFVGTYQAITYTYWDYLIGILLAISVSILSFITMSYKIYRQAIVDDLKYY